MISEEGIAKEEGATVVRIIGSVNAPIAGATDHFILKDDGKYSFHTNGDVLLGTMSFQMTVDEFDISWFKLVPSAEYNPTSGIKISVTTTKRYEAQSTFRFTDDIASKEASLSNLVVSHGKQDEANPDNSTYQEYPLTPTFDKDTLQYEIKLLEYIDDMDITATTLDGKATLKIKVPKRDETGELVYQEDGATIEYEEKEMQDKTQFNITLNKLGEPDTILTIISTAEDGKTIKEYQVTIKRPYATLKGRAILADFDDESVVSNIFDIYGVQVNNRVQINFYEAGLADWETITDIYHLQTPDPFTYEKLEKIPKETAAISKDDGTYEIYVIPKKYDIQVMRLGYLDYIYSDVELSEGDVIEMGSVKLPAGDANRDSLITQEDMNEIKSKMDMNKDDPEFSEACNPSQVGYILQEDLNYARKGQDKMINIVYFKK
ncbi:MAG: cadherin-like beta sandwich domain-containing protein [Clostridia bacterium]|nr:cadherin-like beta sandwich domain-containing protein [Clostridia bacterium]